MNFKLFLENEDLLNFFTYFNPDSLYQKPGFNTFVHDLKDNILYIGKDKHGNGLNHRTLLKYFFGYNYEDAENYEEFVMGRIGFLTKENNFTEIDENKLPLQIIAYWPEWREINAPIEKIQKSLKTFESENFDDIKYDSEAGHTDYSEIIIQPNCIVVDGHNSAHYINQQHIQKIVRYYEIWDGKRIKFTSEDVVKWIGQFHFAVKTGPEYGHAIFMAKLVAKELENRWSNYKNDQLLRNFVIQSGVNSKKKMIENPWRKAWNAIREPGGSYVAAGKMGLTSENTLNEMPINKAEFLGKDWNKFKGDRQHQSWDKASYNIRYINDPDFQKLKNKWINVPQTFDMYFVKATGMRSFLETGEVSKDHRFFDYLKKSNIKIPEIDEDNITVFFTNNSAAERIPMTPWTIGHRFGHASRNIHEYQEFTKKITSDFESLLRRIYGKEKPPSYTYGGYGGYGERETNKRQNYDAFLRQLMQAFGTMRSAKMKLINRIGEFTHELFGQYIINGKITFNEEIPRQLVTKYSWGRPTWDGSAYSKVKSEEKEGIIEKVREMADNYNYMCADILDACIGKIFVM